MNNDGDDTNAEGPKWCAYPNRGRRSNCHRLRENFAKRKKTEERPKSREQSPNGAQSRLRETTK